MAKEHCSEILRAVMAKIQKVIIDKEGESFYVKDLTKDFHTKFGVFSSKDIKNGKVKTNTGKEFFVFDAGFVDKFHKLKRVAQIITLKDAGVIIAETGINNKSKVVEAGGGSGGLTCALANIAKQVVSYEIRKEFVEVINENLDNLGLKNVKVKNKDISLGISEKELDLVVLDMPDPEKVIAHAAKSLKNGGFLVCYLPSMTQVISVANEIRINESFILTKVCETLQREWKVEGKIARPEFQMLGHTGFLVFARRI